MTFKNHKKYLTFIILCCFVVNSLHLSAQETTMESEKWLKKTARKQWRIKAKEKKRKKSISANDFKGDLSNWISKLPGVTVNGIGSNAQISIRSNRNELEFTLNGISIRGSYQSLYALVEPSKIISVRLLRGGGLAGNDIIAIKEGQQ